jgi:hypothetical protein
MDYDEDLTVSDLDFEEEFDRKRKRSKKAAKSIVYVPVDKDDLELDPDSKEIDDER